MVAHARQGPRGCDLFAGAHEMHQARAGPPGGRIKAWLIGLRPDFAAAYNNLGSAYAAEGKNDEAMAAWTRAVRSDANGAAGRAARANLDTTRARLSR